MARRTAARGQPRSARTGMRCSRSCRRSGRPIEGILEIGGATRHSPRLMNVRPAGPRTRSTPGVPAPRRTSLSSETPIVSLPGMLLADAGLRRGMGASGLVVRGQPGCGRMPPPRQGGYPSLWSEDNLVVVRGLGRGMGGIRACGPRTTWLWSEASAEAWGVSELVVRGQPGCGPRPPSWHGGYPGLWLEDNLVVVRGLRRGMGGIRACGPRTTWLWSGASVEAWDGSAVALSPV